MVGVKGFEPSAPGLTLEFACRKPVRVRSVGQGGRCLACPLALPQKFCEQGIVFANRIVFYYDAWVAGILIGSFFLKRSLTKWSG